MTDSGFFDRTGELDELINSRPLDGVSIARVFELISDKPLRIYFFEHLNDDTWLEPLSDAGVFNNPPSSLSEPWPESRYLARIAKIAPDFVSRVIEKIPETANLMVHLDLADAAAQMPPGIAVAWATREASWANEQNSIQFFLAGKLATLVGHLAGGEQSDSALALARSLFSLVPGKSGSHDAEETTIFVSEPRPKFDLSYYGQELAKQLPAITRGAKLRALDLFADLLDSGIELSRRKSDEGGDDDYSYIWRPAIENNSQNFGYQVKESLITAVRDSAQLLVSERLESISRVVEQLRKRKWKVFVRIILYLLIDHGDSMSSLVAQMLVDRNVFFNPYGIKHEYVLVLRKHFGMLQDEQKEEILNWIDEGPDASEFVEFRTRLSGKEPSEVEVQQYRSYWQRDRLFWLKDYLPEKWQARLEALVKEVGSPGPSAEYESYTAGPVSGGPSSPKSASQISEMTIVQVVNFLKSFQPTADFWGPSDGGLAVELTSAVEKRPSQFAECAIDFKDTRPAFVRALIWGLYNAAKKSKAFDWKDVLKLCKAVIDDESGPPEGRAAQCDASTRQAVASLVEAGFDEGPSAISFSQRGVIWAILEILLKDPRPTPQDEAAKGGSLTDYINLSLNTVRGRAMHCVIRYALWARRTRSQEPEHTADDFDWLRHVKEVLELHLESARDPALTIRAVYGQWFPWLTVIDKQWATENAPRIFPTGESQALAWGAAWNTYLAMCPAYDDVCNILVPQYRLAVERLKVSAHAKPPESDIGLAHHLMTLFWRGKLDTGEFTAIFALFWQKAQDQLRGNAIEFVGRSLRDTKDQVQQNIITRLQTFWQERLYVARASNNSENFKSEMGAFGWWLVSGKFPEDWAVNQFAEAVKIAKNCEPDFLVMERLGQVAKTYPRAAVESLNALVEGDSSGLRVRMWLAELKAVLEASIESGDKQVITISRDIIDRLGALGYWNLRDLAARTREA